VNKIAIALPNKPAYSETFIQSHINYLPAEVEIIYSWPPMVDNRELVPLHPSLREHARRALLRRIGRWTFKQAIDQELAHYFNQFGIQALLAEYGPTGVRFMNACKIAEVPLIVHFHGFDAHQTNVLTQFGARYLELFESAAAIVAPSKHLANRLVELGASRDKVHVNPNGVDTKFFTMGYPNQARPTFVAVGRFVDKKAPHLTLLAFTKVLESIPEARLVMIGNGPLLNVCMDIAEVFNVAHAIEFMGSCTPKQVANTLLRGRAFVQHSKKSRDGDMESFGVVFIEAGAAGLPVIATKHDGIPEVVLHGKTGFLVDEGDVDGMAEYMVRLANDPELAARLGRAARERIEAEFSMEKSIAGLWEIIKGAIRDAA